MVKFRKYTPDDKMITLISNDYRVLHVLSRFGIPLGCGDKTIKEVCDLQGVDSNTFLAIVNFMVSRGDDEIDIADISLSSLLQYLKQSHGYFLDFYLPSIRRKLLDAITLKDSDVSFLIIKLFDEYVEGVKAHMLEEEQTLFRQVEDIILTKRVPEKLFPVYNPHHEEVGSKLRELKNILIKYCPENTRENLLNAALYDIFRCEEELDTHCKIEDLLLLPAMRAQNK